MGRRSEAGQLVIETAILALLFVGLFLLAFSICEHGEAERAKYRFEQPRTWR